MEINLTEKQSLVFQTTVDELFFGGAAGPGKTFVNKVLAVTVCLQVPGAQVAILRNTSKNLKKNYLSGAYSLPKILYDHIQSKMVSINNQDMVITFKHPKGDHSAIHLMHCEQVQTACDNLQGNEFVLIIADEAALIDSEILDYCKSRLRLGSLKITDPFWKERLPRFQLTSNPGGISHSYLKQEYIDPAPAMTEFVDEESGLTRMFIPAFASDNEHVDESYVKQLKALKDPLKFKQLSEGDWDAGGAAFFADAFKRTKNVIPDFKIPEGWWISRCYDPGYSSPFGYVIIAKVKGNNHVKMSDGTTRYFPNDSRIVYREWYGFKGGKNLNEGLQWQHNEIAATMKAKEEGWGLKGRVKPGRADWKIWDGELNVYQDYQKEGIIFSKADKAKGSRTTGALKMRELMLAAHEEPLESPALFFVESCIYSIKTIPELPTDPKNPDDVVTEGVCDHLYDCIRYEVCSPEYKLGTMKVMGT